jgi:hypothetical protein
LIKLSVDRDRELTIAGTSASIAMNSHSSPCWYKVFHKLDVPPRSWRYRYKPERVAAIVMISITRKVMKTVKMVSGFKIKHPGSNGS